MDLFLTNVQLFTFSLQTWWTGVVWITYWLLWYFYQLFELSFWRHPSTAEDPLVSKLFSKSVAMEKMKSWIVSGWVIVKQILIWVNYSFKLCLSFIKMMVIRLGPIGVFEHNAKAGFQLHHCKNTLFTSIFAIQYLHEGLLSWIE